MTQLNHRIFYKCINDMSRFHHWAISPHNLQTDINIEALAWVNSKMITCISMQYYGVCVCVLGAEILFLSALLMFSASTKEWLANTNTDNVLCPTRVPPHVLSPRCLKKWFFSLGSDNSGIAAGKCLFCIHGDGFWLRPVRRPRRTERTNREGVVIRIRTYSCVLPLLPFLVVSWREDFCLLESFKLALGWERLKAVVDQSKFQSVCLNIDGFL